mmetsp:Transcript_89284/g.277649  ORF Transcript_89284/g.277649 Transcript_89284/m.277649 type:complete len:988 (-) Transcript_89284:114-3077(-)
MNERRARFHCLFLPLPILLVQDPRSCLAGADGLAVPHLAAIDCETCYVNTTLPSRGSSLLTVGVERIRTFGGAFPGKIKAKSKTKRIVPGTGGTKTNIWSNTNKTKLDCGDSVFAPGYSRCPKSCPLSSLDPKKPCHWRCVARDDCGKDDPEQNIADMDMLICRDCLVVGCGRCTPGRDFCEQCKIGYELINGDCRPHGRSLWGVLFGILGILLVIGLAWYGSLLCGAEVNPLVLRQALVHRVRASLRHRANGKDEWYPILTNLGRLPTSQSAPIGGPGIMLLFRFQAFLLAWVICAMIGWFIAANVLGYDMLVVGIFMADDAQEMCQAVRWGRRVRDQLRWGKFLFTVLLYVVTTFAVIAFAVKQHRRFQEADSRTSTMMDYAAVCTGFPPDGRPSTEEDIQDYVHSATGLRPVGVSVCWDYANFECKVMTLLSNEVRRREARCLNDPCFTQYQLGLDGQRQRRWTNGRRMTVRTSLASRAQCLFKPLFSFIDSVLGVPDEGKEDCRGTTLEADEDQVEADELLKEITSSGTAIIVFQTESDRDEALQTLSKPLAPMYKGRYVIRASREFYEPQAICWTNFVVTPAQVAKRMTLGVLGTLIAIVIWGMLFYAPYAYFEAETFITTGEAPGFVSELVFSMLVVIGNQIMYFLCSAIAERVGFKSKDHAQEAYVLLYTGAVLVNTVVDITIVVYTTYISMMARDVRTDDGILLEDLPDSVAVFESYPMMKVFGRTLYEYNFPACFLIPFIAEAIFTVILPYHLGYRMVKTRSVSRENAESCLQPIPMDLARYGDLIVNFTLTAMCFFTASGWVLKTFIGLAIGNIFVYAFDQYRVLRQVEDFYMASGDIDAAAQRLLSIPCAVLAGAVMFQLHGLFPHSQFMESHNIWILLLETFLLHIVVHLLLTALAVKHFGHVEHEAAERQYSEVAAEYPGNWFTSNPVHCLRSLYLHKHPKPCVYYIKGKEAYLEADEARGMYYKPQIRHPSGL